MWIRVPGKKAHRLRDKDHNRTECGLSVAKLKAAGGVILKRAPKPADRCANCVKVYATPSERRYRRAYHPA